MKKILSIKVKDMNGITLIALVITIVVLIILAAVAINLSLGNNGIFNRAKSAKEQYSNAQDYEATQISKYTNKIDSIVDGNRDTVTLTLEEYEHIINKSAITVSSSTAAALNTTKTKYPFTTVDTQKGTNLTLENGGVKIGSGITHILVTARHYLGGGDQACGDSHIYKNDTEVCWSTSRMSGASDQWFDIFPYVISVSEGDYIYFYANRGGATSTIKQFTMTVVEL